MRIRTIKPCFFKHDGIAELEPLTRILFIGLWSLADCAGRLEDRPARIKVEVLPYDKADADKMLNELERAGFIVRYEAEGLKLIEINAFSRHQRITGKEAETDSRFPKYDGETTGKQSGNNRETSETTGREWKGMETEGNGNDALPLPFPSDSFAQAWKDWESSKREARKPLKPTTIKLQFAMLSKLGEARAIAALIHSTTNAYTGIFEPTKNGNTPRSPQPPALTF